MNGQVRLMLIDCSPTAQWLFQKIEPVLEQSRPYGYIQHYESEIGEMFRTSQTTVSLALHDLRRHGVMRQSKNGYWYCPGMICEMVERALR